MRLDCEGIETHSSFDVELRRRLLFAIGILDTHSALDRGTVPILPSTVFRNPPLRINDHDMKPNYVPRISSSEPTDMTFTAMIYEAMVCQRKLYELSEDVQNVQEHWYRKLELVDAFGIHVKTVVSTFESPFGSLQKLYEISGAKIHASLQLLLRRPPYRQMHNSVPTWDNFDVLDAATKVLELYVQPLVPELEPWAWKNWVQWHVLAVALAELTIRPDGPLSDRAYSVASQVFRNYAGIVADSDSGMLWKPIARLMRQAQRVRQSAGLNLVSAVSTSDHPPTNNGSDSFANLVDTDAFQDLSMLDLSNWTFDIEGSNFLSDYDRPPHVDYDGIEDGRATPWSAWNTFIQDVNLEDT